MKSVFTLVLAAFLPAAALATEAVEQPVAMEDVIVEPDAEEPEGFFAYNAVDVDLADFLWVNRVIVVFADSPANPQFNQQIRILEQGYEELQERDAVVVVDTDPAARSQPRQQLRPRGFSLVFVDKDGDVKQRKPSPWSIRELSHAIDRTPLRRQEMLQEMPGRTSN
jgi:ABC-type sugar transport system substrate-binding protein